MQTRHAAPVALAAALLLSGCGGSDGTPGAAPPDTTGETMPSPTPDVDPGLRGLVDQAVRDLAGRLDVDEDAVTVVSADAVSWGDTSLGCPQPGMRYAQVVTDGTRIVLEHDGATYAYHSGGDRSPFLCEEPERPVQDSKSPAPSIDRTAEDG